MYRKLIYYSAFQLLEVGYSAKERREAGFWAGALTKAGYSVKDFFEGG